MLGQALGEKNKEGNDPPCSLLAAFQCGVGPTKAHSVYWSNRAPHSAYVSYLHIISAQQQTDVSRDDVEIWKRRERPSPNSRTEHPDHPEPAPGPLLRTYGLEFPG